MAKSNAYTRIAAQNQKALNPRISNGGGPEGESGAFELHNPLPAQVFKEVVAGRIEAFNNLPPTTKALWAIGVVTLVVGGVYAHGGMGDITHNAVVSIGSQVSHVALDAMDTLTHAPISRNAKAGAISISVGVVGQRLAEVAQAVESLVAHKPEATPVPQDKTVSTVKKVDSTGDNWMHPIDKDLPRTSCNMELNSGLVVDGITVAPWELNWSGGDQSGLAQRVLESCGIKLGPLDRITFETKNGKGFGNASYNDGKDVIVLVGSEGKMAMAMPPVGTDISKLDAPVIGSFVSFDGKRGLFLNQSATDVKFTPVVLNGESFVQVSVGDTVLGNIKFVKGELITATPAATVTVAPSATTTEVPNPTPTKEPTIMDKVAFSEPILGQFMGVDMQVNLTSNQSLVDEKYLPPEYQSLVKLHNKENGFKADFVNQEDGLDASQSVFKSLSTAYYKAWSTENSGSYEDFMGLWGVAQKTNSEADWKKVEISMQLWDRSTHPTDYQTTKQLIRPGSLEVEIVDFKAQKGLKILNDSTHQSYGLEMTPNGLKLWIGTRLVAPGSDGKPADSRFSQVITGSIANGFVGIALGGNFSKNIVFSTDRSEYFKQLTDAVPNATNYYESAFAFTSSNSLDQINK